MSAETCEERERRESREHRQAMLLALRIAGPGGGTVNVDGEEITVLDLRALLRRS